MIELHLLKETIREVIREVETLNRKSFLPTRDIERLQTMLAGETVTYHDATEREILRPGDHEVQGEYYSGKKTSLHKESRDR